MIKKLRKIALGTVAIAAVIALFATGPEVAQVWSQVANAQDHEDHSISFARYEKGYLAEIQHLAAEQKDVSHAGPPPEIETHH
jgi:hypothetical protein